MQATNRFKAQIIFFIPNKAGMGLNTLINTVKLYGTFYARKHET